MNSIKIGTRSSQLALWQANWIKSNIERLFPAVQIELVLIKTQGDKILDVPLAKVGGKGLFVKELETALLDKTVDIAVHSMKDVPAELPEGLEISVITERDDPGDAFVSNKFSNFASLPNGAIVGTSSLRRSSQIMAVRPDLQIESLRGNVNTRLRKLDEGQFDAIILAAAGLKRLEFESRIRERLPYNVSLPAVAQGAVGIESRTGDSRILQYITPLRHANSTYCVTAERAFLLRLNGGCQVPIAGHAVIEGNNLQITGLVASPDGTHIHKSALSGNKEEGAQLGVQLAEQLLAEGGRKILSLAGIEVA